MPSYAGRADVSKAKMQNTSLGIRSADFKGKVQSPAACIPLVHAVGNDRAALTAKLASIVRLPGIVGGVCGWDQQDAVG